MHKLVLAALVALNSAPALADVDIFEPWVRATVTQQRTTGAFMRLVSDSDTRLVSASSPVAELVQIHEMTMHNDVMKMGPVQGLDLPAGKAVELKPGGYHVMLMGLKAQVEVGDVVPLTLVFEGRDGTQLRVEVSAPARPLNTAAGTAPTKHAH